VLELVGLFSGVGAVRDAFAGLSYVVQLEPLIVSVKIRLHQTLLQHPVGKLTYSLG